VVVCGCDDGLSWVLLPIAILQTNHMLDRLKILIFWVQELPSAWSKKDQQSSLHHGTYLNFCKGARWCCRGGGGWTALSESLSLSSDLAAASMSSLESSRLSSFLAFMLCFLAAADFAMPLAPGVLRAFCTNVYHYQPPSPSFSQASSMGGKTVKLVEPVWISGPAECGVGRGGGGTLSLGPLAAYSFCCSALAASASSCQHTHLRGGEFGKTRPQTGGNCKG